MRVGANRRQHTARHPQPTTQLLHKIGGVVELNNCVALQCGLKNDYLSCLVCLVLGRTSCCFDYYCYQPITGHYVVTDPSLTPLNPPCLSFSLSNPLPQLSPLPHPLPPILT